MAVRLVALRLVLRDELERRCRLRSSRGARGRCGMNIGMLPETSGCAAIIGWRASSSLARVGALLGLGQQRVEILADRRSAAWAAAAPAGAAPAAACASPLEVVARGERSGDGRTARRQESSSPPRLSPRRDGGETPNIGLRRLAQAGGRRLLGPLAAALAARAHLRRAGRRLERRRRRLAGSDARGARLRDLVGVLGGRGHAPNMASPAARSSSVGPAGPERKDVNA